MVEDKTGLQSTHQRRVTTPVSTNAPFELPRASWQVPLASIRPLSGPIADALNARCDQSGTRLDCNG